jgi:hypothetical protein
VTAIATPTRRPLSARTGARLLLDLGACCGPGDAVPWVQSLPAGTTARQAWQQCQRGDWMLWLWGRLAGPPESDSRKRLVLCACECARTAWEWMPAASRACVDTAEKWARGEATIKELRAARMVATTYAATYIADAYDAANDASAAAAYAAYTSAYAYRTRVLAQCADIVRKHYPYPPRLRARKEHAA